MLKADLHMELAAACRAHAVPRRSSLLAYTGSDISEDVQPTKKQLVWVGGSKSDLKDMPVRLQKQFGVALDIVQQGVKPEGTKPLKGKQKGATQLSEDHDGDTYRSVYTAELEHGIYVLHCFKKKSKSGIATPQAGLDVIEVRLKAARDYDRKLGEEK